jgi:hypothetical protein
MLADRLQAGLSASAAARELAARPALEWDTAMAAFALPPACADNPAHAPLLAAAAAALQVRLGDLDAAWADERGAARLRSLPFAALSALLSDEGTRAAGENTVFYTACAWLAAHGGGEPAQREALAAAVRAPHLSPLFAAGVAAQAPWFAAAVPPAELHAAAAFAAAPDAVRERMLSKPGLPLARRAAWRLSPRPPSAAPRALEIVWAVPLARLRELHEKAAAGEPARAESPPHVHGGLEWDVRLHAQQRGGGGGSSDSSNGGGIAIGAFVFAHLPPGCAAEAVVSANVRVEAGSVVRGFTLMPFGVGAGPGASEGRGFADAFGVGARQEWDEAAWRSAGVVGGDDAVTIKVTIRDVA